MLSSRTSASRAMRAIAGNAWTTPVQSDWRSTLARFGLVAKGILYVALGWLTIGVAAGDASSETASRRGAIELVADGPFGQWLIVVLACGLLALALWQVILAFTGDPVEGSERKDRLGYGIKAAIYFGTAATAFTILAAEWGVDGFAAAGAGGGMGEEASQERAAATVMNWPGGPLLVALAGVGLVGLAAYQLYAHTWHQQFMQRLHRGRMSDAVETGVERAGRWGYAARAIAVATVGTFLVIAAVRHDPQEAVGLSGALQALSQQTWGPIVLWIVALGVLLYGCFCFAEARYRRAT